MSRAEQRPDDEATLSGFEWVGDRDPDPEPQPEPELAQDIVRAASWEPRNEQDCQNCGRQVTSDFRRVFGDNDDVVHACMACADQNEVAVVAADPTFAGGER